MRGRGSVGWGGGRAGREVAMATVLGRAWYGGVVGPAGFTPSLPLASGPAAAGSPCRGSPSPPGLTWDKHRVRGGESPGSPFWRKRRGFCVPTSYGVPREELPPTPPPAGALPPQLGRWAPPGPAGAQPERGSVCGDRDGAGPRCRMRPGAKEEGSPF